MIQPNLPLNDQIFFKTAKVLRQYGLNELRYWTDYLVTILDKPEELEKELTVYSSGIVANIYRAAVELDLI